MKVWEGKQVIGFLLTWRLLRPQLQQRTTDKYHRFPSCYRKFMCLLTDNFRANICTLFLQRESAQILITLVHVILKHKIIQFGRYHCLPHQEGKSMQKTAVMYYCIIHGISQNNNDSLKPWPHRLSVSASALMLPSILENGYDADTWYGLYRYKSLCSVAVAADAQCGQGLNIEVQRWPVNTLQEHQSFRTIAIC